MKKYLVIDNYDSFTYNLVQYMERILGYRVDVFRNTDISLDQIARYDKILLSPGPGLPHDAGIMPLAIKTFAASKSILGVCLGHQAIGEAFGGQLEHLGQVLHGIATPTLISVPDEVLFREVPNRFLAGRYHSWTVSPSHVPDCITVTSVDERGHIMSLRHNTFDVRGVQFHPESILTDYGYKILANWINH